AYIGNTADGSLTVDGGDDLVCKYGRIAHGPGVTGEATITGADSTWTASIMYVGVQGNGTLRIAEDAVVNAGRTFVACEEGSTGNIVFGPGGGTLRTSSLVASPAQLTGTGTIETRGLVSDVDLVFDLPESLVQTFHFNNPDLGQDVTLTLDVTDPAATGILGVGYQDAATLTVRGMALSMLGSYVGFHTGSHGTLLIDGAGSAWTSTVIDTIGYRAGSTGEVTVRGAGATWASRHCFIGKYGNGSVEVIDGASVNTDTVWLGCEPGSTGALAVRGTGSSWSTSNMLYVGSLGTGTLAVAEGGTVSVEGCLYAAQGEVTVSDASSVSIHGGLYLAHGGNATLAITSGGGVTGPDATIIGMGPGVTGNVTISGTNSKLSGYWLIVGERGMGKLAIMDRGMVSSKENASIGDEMGSVGQVLVSGVGSTWTHEGYYAFTVGNRGSGMLTITDGGTVENWSDAFIGHEPASTGRVSVVGAGSLWINHRSLDISGGRLVVADGGNVASHNARVRAAVTVSGDGSLWSNDDLLSIGEYGVLSVADGGLVTTSEVSLYSTFRSLLSIDVAHDSRLVIDGGAGKLANNGTVRLVAGASAATGGPYTPILAGAWEGTGVYQAVGGTWDPGEHEFFASAVLEADAGETVGFDAVTVQRVLVTDAETARSVGLSFLAPAASQMLAVAAAPVADEIVGQLEETLATTLPDPQAVRAAWEFTVTGYDTNDPAYLSFTLGPHVAAHDLTVWRYGGTSWSQFDAWDLTYDGQYASFTVDGFGAYAAAVALAPGDANGDGFVNNDDAAALAAHWLQSGGWSDGDFNADGTVDDLDLAILAANWQPAADAPAVPEPAMVVLLAVLALAALAARRK
ncbi:MAG: hypothetical protein JW809_02610, partial [Pirellulales bacterium]|nr:hypothetical protein [Pirellulales bacterium]